MVSAYNDKKTTGKHARHSVRLRPLSVAIHVAVAGGIVVGTLPGGLRAELPSPAAAWSQMTGTTYRFGTTTATFSDRNLRIDQRDNKVVLDWNSFSIGAGNSVTFRQPGKDAVAVNKVIGTDPSRIFGNLNANGQVYLINTNGILFGRGSQVNVRSLVASTLDMTQEALDNGILAPGVEGRPAFEGNGTGSVNIQAGAVLRANGGRVLVFAPQITNAGLIQTPDGQTVLAAGQKIYISSVEITDTTNPELIGQLLVEVDVSGVTPEELQAFLRGESATLPAGTASNRGVIEALRGNVSMVGLAVNQNGRVSATTSVRQNGSIRLVASDRSTASDDPTRGGRVQLGAASVTKVELELASTATAVDADTQDPSSIRMAGHSVHIERNAQVLAPAGEVEISANAEGATTPNLANAPTNDSRVRIAEGARIDVSGANIAMPVSSNLLEVELRGAQLQDSPYQRDGVLRNATIVVDIRETGVREDGTEWVGTPLADLRADIAAVGKTVGERSVQGGSVSIASQGDALIEQGSTIDVSGGAIQYLDDGMTTTKLVSDGRVYDIADAPEALRYDQLLTTFTKDFTKWGVRRVWNLFPNRNESGYVRGFDAGSFHLVASRGALEGTLRGGVVVGPKQRERAPRGGEFVFGLPPSEQIRQDFDLRSPDITFSPLKRLNALLATGFNVYGDALPAAFDSFFIDPELFDEQGMHRGRIYSNGRILLPQDVTLIMPAGGSLALTAGQIDVRGDIVIPAGSITLETRDTSTMAADLARIDVGAHSRLDTRGTWTNDTPIFSPVLGPIHRNGGSVSLIGNGGAGVFLARGSHIDVSGGGWLDADGNLNAGTAGSIDLRAIGTGEFGILPPRLVVNGALAGYALGTGGSLRMDASSVCIGAAACTGQGMHIDPRLFQQGGFNRYALNANQGGLTVARDALIRPLTESWLLNPGFAFQPNGADLALFTRREVLPELERAPVTLSLSANAKSDGGFSATNFMQAGYLDLQAGSSIVLDPRSSVNLSSNTRLHLAGSIVAPAGSITATLTNGLSLTGYIANQTLWLTDTANLDVRGVAQVQPNALGQREGEVLAGGRIELTADRGYIVAERGARLDVSGTRASLDIPNGRNGVSVQSVTGDAGTIALTAAEGMLLNATLRGEAGGAGAAGGELQITLDASNRNHSLGDAFDFPDTARSIRITDGNAAQQPAGLDPDDTAVFTAVNGQARIAEGHIMRGGFDRLQLTARNLFDKTNALSATGEVRLADGVELNLNRDIRIDAAALTVPGSAELSAAYVALGSTDRISQDVATTIAGDGGLIVNADLIDVIGHSRIQETASVSLNSRGDIRLRGVQLQNGLELNGSLTTDGDLDLRADQVYPATLSDFTLEVTGAGGNLRILPGDGDAAPVLSAGGALHLRADNIVQRGTLKAPIGELDLVADERLVLGRGSVTSTSADGLTIPFGRLEAGEDWVYALQEQRFRVYTGSGAQPLPQKRITLDGTDIEVRDGAVVDLSGGGDLLAYEFVPGIDGTRDVLDPRVGPNTFAILPSSGLDYAPYDAQEMVGSTLQAGDSVYLSGGNGLPAGTYTLLPARYALLPGAWLVQAVDGYRDLPDGQSIRLPNGSTVVSGYRSVAGTDIRDSRNSGFAVRSGSDLQQFARYDTATANEFFPDAAERDAAATPRLPGDAGTLAIAPRNSLLLEGSLRAVAVNGARGSAVDIAAELLAVTGTSGGTGVPAGFVQLDAGQLSAFGAESLLLGALRERDAEETRLDVRAREVRVNGDVDLTIPDLILAARERIEVVGGADLTARGTAQTGDAVLRAEGDGALLRLSADEQVRIDRGDAATGAQGDLIIGAGVQLNAAQSAVLDATRDTQSQGDLIMDGGSLNLGAYRISLGAATDVNEGLVLGIEDLRQARVDELVLTSRTSVDIYGAPNLDVNDLHIEAAGINGYANSGQTARIHATGDISLSNREGVSDANAATGDGSLQLSAAERLTLGEGEFAVNGFAQTALDAGREIVGDGTGSLTVAGDLTLHAPRITATQGADTTIRAQDAADIYHQVTITQPGTRPANLPLADLGARLNIEAARIEHGGNIELNAGLLTLTARGDAADDGVHLRDGSTIDLSGRSVVFDGVPVYASGGKLTASAAHGDVTLDGDIDLSAPAGGGDAGRLTVNAAEGELSIGGSLQATADRGGRGGEARLDADDLGAFSALNTTLNGAGFTQQRDLRQRSGDISIAATDTVTAHAIQITADAGALTVAGTLNASGSAGGRIQLNADQNLNVVASAVIDAHATAGDGDAAGDGGRVDLRSQNGGVFLNTGSVIDVRGGGNGRGGAVQLRLPRGSVLSVLDADGTNDELQLAATILGAAQHLLEGHAVYTEADGSIDAAQVGTGSVWYTEADSFIAASAGASAAAGAAEFVVRPGIEIRSPGDLTLAADWNLNAWRFNGQPGVLTLRAGGDLNVGSPTASNRSSAGALSDGFVSATTNASTASVVLPGVSWSYRLVAGADQASADLLAVRALDDLPEGGDFKVANGTYSATAPQTRVVRTGTGEIDIAAAQDVILGNAASVVYTAGEASDGIKLTPLGTTREYPDNGGDVRVRAGRDARGVDGNQLVSHWLFRAGNASGATGWTVAYERFQQGIGALGGGDVQLSAGRDIDNLSAAIPSIGKQVGGTAASANVVEIVGGGDLSVDAGRDIASGLYYVGRGDARINADGAVTSNRNGANGPLHTVLALGDGAIDMQARGALELESVFNPTLVVQNAANGSFTQKSFFATYSADSAVTLTSLSGAVALNNDADGLARASGLTFNGANGDVNALILYPGTLTAQALQGDVQLHGSAVWMAPAAKGNLQLFAAGDVQFPAGMTFNMSDADPVLLPSPAQPSQTFASTYAAFLGFGQHAATPVHADAAQPDGIADRAPVRIITLDGDIRMLADNLSADAVKLLLPKSARLVAGRDIRDLELVAQNLRDTDVTTLTAGRDIVYSISRSPEGSLQLNQRDITLDGPGLLELIAGRDINLGTSPGVQTRGNGFNTNLADTGAGVLVLAGTDALAIDAFIIDYPRYFTADSFAAQFRAAIAAVAGGVPSDTETALAVYRGLSEEQQAVVMQRMNLPERYAGSFAGTAEEAGYFGAVQDLQARMIDFVRAYTGESLSAAEAMQRFPSLDTAQQRQFAIQALFNELKWSGRVEARTGNNEYPLGFAAVDTLFPRNDYAGDIRMVLSTIRTLLGGDIMLLAPGGRINAGLSTPPASLGSGKGAAELGVVAQSRGDVHAFADDDIQVEESRIFAADGGDIIAWSSNGDVDAGRGSKAALSVPPPVITFNPDGSVKVNFPPSLTGSGIRAFASSTGTSPGDVDLYAPRGVVNAGDAGIGGGNITLGATAILGADNIDVGGISVGVPVADSGSLAAGLTGISNLSSSVSKLAEQSASGLGGDEDALSGKETLGFLSVDILGFGD